MKILAFFLLLLVGCGGSGPSSTSHAPKPAAEAISPEAFASVKSAFEKAGARVELDSEGNAVRVYLPMSVAMELSETQAKTMAAAARAKLGDRAVVYIKGPGGNTLGKSSWYD
jgi:hypothetical protein